MQIKALVFLALVAAVGCTTKVVNQTVIRDHDGGPTPTEDAGDTKQGKDSAVQAKPDSAVSDRDSASVVEVDSMVPDPEPDSSVVSQDAEVDQDSALPHPQPGAHALGRSNVHCWVDPPSDVKGADIDLRLFWSDDGTVAGYTMSYAATCQGEEPPMQIVRTVGFGGEGESAFTNPTQLYNFCEYQDSAPDCDPTIKSPFVALSNLVDNGYIAAGQNYCITISMHVNHAFFEDGAWHIKVNISFPMLVPGTKHVMTCFVDPI